MKKGSRTHRGAIRRNLNQMREKSKGATPPQNHIVNGGKKCGAMPIYSKSWTPFRRFSEEVSLKKQRKMEGPGATVKRTLRSTRRTVRRRSGTHRLSWGKKVRKLREGSETRAAPDGPRRPGLSLRRPGCGRRAGGASRGER